MKKSLIALAALAAVSAASAQSTVTLSGNLDMAYSSTGGTTNAQNKAQNIGAYAGSSTSSINIEAMEDLGGGLMAGARFELDPRGSLADGVAMTMNQSYVNIGSAAFGTVKAGRPNSPSYDAFAAASPLGTATGSGYSYTSSGVAMATRFNRSARYDTPVFSGFSASALYAPGNDSPAGTTTAYVGLPYQRSVTDIGVKYLNGPLNIAFGYLAAGSQANAATVAPTGNANQGKTSLSSIGANYTFGAFTGYVGYNTGDTLGTAASASSVVSVDAVAAGLKTKGTRLGVKYVIGNTTLLASTAKQDIDFTTGVTTSRKVSGLRAEQALSKRTAVYFAYETYNTGLVATSTITAATANGKINTTAVGIRHSF